MKMDTHAPNAEARQPSHGTNAITDLFQNLHGLIQAYGWYVILGLIALYMLQPQLQRMRAEWSLRQANNPTRRKILDDERKRVRLQQQLDLLRAQEKKTEHELEGEREEDTDSISTSLGPDKPTTLKKRIIVKKDNSKKKAAESL
jgi:hypothetical protein